MRSGSAATQAEVSVFKQNLNTAVPRKKLGQYIRKVDARNTDLAVERLLGINIDKFFMPSVANIVGTDMAKYKVVRRGQFACNRMHVGRDERIPIALSDREGAFLVSPAYDVFEISRPEELDAAYLMMWFSRAEFDRNAWFFTDADVRGGLHWDAFCELELPVPSIGVQREIVAEYRAVVGRIALLGELNARLEETAQTVFREMFGGYSVDRPEELPEGWEVKELGKLTSKIGSGSTPRGGKDVYSSEGTSFVRSLNVYDFYFSHENLAYISQEASRKLNNVALEPGDILLNITGASVARCCLAPEDIFPARVNQHVSIIRIASEIGSQSYFLSLLRMNESKQKLLGISESGSTRQAITKSDIENFKVILPDSSVLNEFDKRAQYLFHHMNILIREIQSITKLKNLLLARMAGV